MNLANLLLEPRLHILKLVFKLTHGPLQLDLLGVRLLFFFFRLLLIPLEVFSHFILFTSQLLDLALLHGVSLLEKQVALLYYLRLGHHFSESLLQLLNLV